MIVSIEVPEDERSTTLQESSQTESSDLGTSDSITSENEYASFDSISFTENFQVIQLFFLKSVE